MTDRLTAVKQTIPAFIQQLLTQHDALIKVLSFVFARRCHSKQAERRGANQSAGAAADTKLRLIT